MMTREELVSMKRTELEAIARSFNVKGIVDKNKAKLADEIVAKQDAPVEIKIEEELVHIPEIEKFLAEWHAKAFKFYKELKAEYKAKQFEKYEITEENLKLVRRNVWSNEAKFSDEKIASILEDLKTTTPNTVYAAGIPIDNIKAMITHQRFYNWKSWYTKSAIDIVERMFGPEQQQDNILNTILSKEVESKQKNLIKRVTDKVGIIQDATALTIGADGSLNGIVIGDKGTVSVNAIYAGGYNIQVLHYRVLIKEIK